MAKVNPQIIEWALNWNDIDIEELSTKAGFKSLLKWLNGDKQPTIKQLEKLAKKTHTIVPYFFMESIPAVQLQIPDFRTGTGSAPKSPSPELYETIDELLFRQGWMSDYFHEQEYEPVECVGRFDTKPANIDECVDYLYEYLELSHGWASKGSYYEAVRKLRDQIEQRRIAVSITGYCKGSTRRTFNVDEFRGFVLSDEYAPIVFVNGKDAKVAQLFTMIHEIAHLLFSESGLLNDDDTVSKSDIDTERICDRIAAEFLAPSSDFIRVWENENNVEAAIAAATKYFKISYVTCIRRALEINLIKEDRFWNLYNEHKKEAPVYLSSPNKSSKGDSYNNYGSKLGKVFTEAIYTALKTGYLQYGDAYKMTGLKSDTFDNYYRKKGYVL